jgi:hypothetical protein
VTGHDDRRFEFARQLGHEKGGQAVGEERGLGVEGVGQIRFGTFPAQAAEREPKRGIGAIESAPEDRAHAGQLGAHPDELRTLTREDVGGGHARKRKG